MFITFPDSVNKEGKIREGATEKIDKSNVKVVVVDDVFNEFGENKRSCLSE